MAVSKTIPNVEGMSCRSCVAHVPEVLSIVGVANVEVLFEQGAVKVEHEPMVSPRRLFAALQAARYDATPRRDQPGSVSTAAVTLRGSTLCPTY
jgi:copper chaperone CopZ